MNILEIIKNNEEVLIKHRRHLHKYPELSNMEVNTVEYILSELKKLNIDCVHVKDGGVLAFIKGKTVGKKILLRADIDALPIDEIKNERNECYISENKGVMHACGHDGHTAMLLVAAKVLSENSALFNGEVVCCFEQGEESTFNIRYLLKYIEDNHLEFDCCFGMHISPYLNSGEMMIQENEVMAGIGKFHINLIGQGGHGSRPDLCHNPIDGFATIYTELSRLPLLINNPFKPFAVSIGQVVSGNASNVIPEKLHFRGTYRFYDIDQGLTFRNRMQDTINSIAKNYQLKVEYESLPYPSYPLINNQEVCEFAKEALKEFKSDFVDSTPWMGSESFPYYQLQTPGMFMFLGVKNKEKGITSDIHNPSFDLDEDILYKGVYAHVMMCISFLNSDVKFSHQHHSEDVTTIFRKLGYEL